MVRRESSISEKKAIVFWIFLMTLSPLFAQVDSLQRVVREASDDSTKALAMQELSLVFVDTDFKKFSEYTLKAIDYATKSSNYQLESKILSNSGSIFLRKGLFEQAVHSFNRQLELGEKNQDKNITGRGYFNLANVKLTLLDFSTAVEYLQKAHTLLTEYAVENGSPLKPYEELIIYNSFGLVYTWLEKYDLATEYFMKGIKVSKGEGDYITKVNISKLLNNYADLFVKQKKLDEAEAILLESLKLNEELDYKAGLFTSFLYLGNLKLNEGDFQSAFSFLKEARLLAESHYGFSDKYHVAKALAELYKNMNKPDSALYFLEISRLNEDSLSVQKAKEELLKIDLQNQFNTIQASLEEEKNKIVRRGFLFFLLLLGLTVFLFFFLRRKFLENRNSYQKLEDRHESILEEKEKLIDEIQLKEQEILFAQIKASKNSELIGEISNKTKALESILEKDESLKKIFDELKNSSKDTSWTEFEIRFKQIHGQFYENLLNTYPDLSLNERRLAAFLKLQMTTKEISKATGQSIRAVELGRSRLRKKLGLTNTDINLYDFFLKFD